jgi:transposase-like protein
VVGHKFIGDPMNKCPICGFPRVKNGVLKLKYRGNVQKWICKKCGCQTRNDEIKGYVYPKKMIDAAISLCIDGLRLEKVRKNLDKIFGIFVKSLATIWNWVQKFTIVLSFIFASMSDMIHADETQIKTKKKGFYYWFWACKEPLTGIIAGWHLSWTRSEEDAKKFLENVRKHLPVGVLQWPKKIRTDSLASYYPAINKAFSREIKQDKFKSFKNHSNNVIENFFRCKCHFPKFGGNINAARKYLESWVNEYNIEKIAKMSDEQRKMIKIKNFVFYFMGFYRILSYTK